MINKITSSVNESNYHNEYKKQQKKINLKNCSPNELASFVSELHNEKRITLKETIVFTPLDTNPLMQATGKKVRLKYYSDLWKNPDSKRNILAEYENMLLKMEREKVDKNSFLLFKDAISFLEKINNYRKGR